MGRAKLTDDEGRASYSEAVNKFERDYQEYIAELRHRYQWPEKSRRERKWFRLDPRSITTILARLVSAYGSPPSFNVASLPLSSRS